MKLALFRGVVLSAVVLSSAALAQNYNALNPATFFGPRSDGTLQPGDRGYLTTGSFQRGMAFDPIGGYLVLVDRATSANNANMSGGIYVFHALNAADVGTLDASGIQGGTFATLAVGVGDDGVVYVGNMVTDGTANAFKLYRWESSYTFSFPTLAFSGDPGSGRAQRWGDTMDVRGAGANTQIILGSRTSGSVIGTNVAMLTTTDGATFTVTTLRTDVADNATGGGIAFGAGNTFWAKNADVPLRQFSFDLAAGTATTLRSYGPDVLPASRTLEPLAVDVANNLLATVDMMSGVDVVRLYDISVDPPALLDMKESLVNNGNAGTTKGYVDFGSDFGTPTLHVHNINNGIYTFYCDPTPLVPPVIRKQPASQRMLSGRTATLEVLAYPAATYQWQRNGTNVPNATNGVLRIVNAQPANAGAYRVIVSNAGGTTVSDEAILNIINPEDLYHLVPLWAKTPAAAVNVTNYATFTASASIPNERNIAYNPNLNQLYVQQRDGTTSTRFAVHVVDATTGAWLYRLNTNGIFLNVPALGGSTGIAIDGLDVAGDGAIYACNMTADACGCANPNGVFRIYRWANSDSNTLPVQIFQGDPAAQTVSVRWGDVLGARGSGLNTQLILDNYTGARLMAILRPVDESLTAFSPTAFTQDSALPFGGSIGRSLDFGAGDKVWQKRKAVALLESSFDLNTATTTNLAIYTNFPAALGPVAVDEGRKLVIGINFVSVTTTPDTLDLYEMSDPGNPLLLGQYNFPANHINNANFIGRVLISGDKVFALNSHNGVLAFRIASGPLSPPSILRQPQDVRVIAGNSVTFEVITADEARFQWQREGVNIPGATSSKLILNNVQVSDAGAYRVIVSNDIGSTNSDAATLTVLPAEDFHRLSPLWSLAPQSRDYLRRDTDSQGRTPLYRGIAYNALSNQVYLIGRSSQVGLLGIYVLDATTGADLYQLNHSPISGGSIVLLGMGVAEDGALYAANMADLPSNPSHTYNLYRWENSDPNTVPVLVFSGDPALPLGTAARWGDTLAVRGAGANTKILVDASSGAWAAVFRAVDETMTGFASTPFSQLYGSGSIGRSLEFGTGNTFWQKRKGARLQWSSYDLTAQTSTPLTNYLNFPESLGPVALDLSRNLLAGISFSGLTNVADTLDLYDISDFDNPLLIAKYDFPISSQQNANFIGQVLFAGNRVWAVDGNKGVMAFAITPPSGPPLSIARSGGSVVISWPAIPEEFVLQQSASLAPASWTDVTAVPDVQDGRKIVTENASGATQFYRLCKECP